MATTASDGTYYNEDSFRCGDAAECHADDHVDCTPEEIDIDTDKRVVRISTNDNRGCTSVLFEIQPSAYELVCSCDGSYAFSVHSNRVPNLREKADND